MARPTSKPAIGPERAKWRHSGHTPRRNAGLAAYENVLARAGLSPVAGIDEAGRGACAGPLVVAAVVLDCAAIRRMPGLADSKLLTPEERESAYTEVMRWALDWHVVAIPPQEVDALGLHVCNVEGMRRALAGLRRRPGYVLTDGFPVRGLGAPTLAVWKGDQVTASVAAASVVAKVTRDRVMVELDGSYPAYGFARHKGYSTPEHMAALCGWGPCPEHRYSYVNVRQANRRWATGWQGESQDLAGGPDLADGPDLAGGPDLADGPDLAGGPDLADGPGPAEGIPDGGLEPGAVLEPGGDPEAADGPAVADGEHGGNETPGSWADFVPAEVTAVRVSQAGTTWAEAPHGAD
jgi:ribonuclease HII